MRFDYENKDRGMWLYHPEKAPKGKFFKDSFVAGELKDRDGWVDTPDKFPGADKRKPVVEAPVAVVSSAVEDEKLLFSSSVKSAVENQTEIPYNEVFLHMSGKELEDLLANAGLAKGLDLRKNIDKLRTEVKSIFKAHNDGLGAE